MKFKLASLLCAVAALFTFSVGSSNAQNFPPGIPGNFYGIELTMYTTGEGAQVPTYLGISRAGRTLRVTQFQIIEGQHINVSTILRPNGTADTVTSVDGVVVQSGTGRYSVRGRVINVNLGITNALASFFQNQRITLRGNRVAVQQVVPQFGIVNYLLADRM